MVHHKGMRTQDMTPAQYVIKLFGGVRPLARQMNLTHPAVIGWTKYRNGAGLIPPHVQGRLLELARRRGLKLCADDFIV